MRASAEKLKSFGVQLYTVRNVIGKDPDGVLAQIAEAGYKEIEGGLDDIEVVTAAALKAKLKPVSVNLPTELFLTKQNELPAALETAKKHGYQYALLPWIDPKDRGGVEMIKKLAGNLNTTAAKCQAMGLQFCYHNHAFEFAKAGETTLMEVLLKETDPKLVGWEMDIFWVSVTGNDPIEWLKRYPGRVKLLHVKDLAAGVPVRFDERVPATAFKEAGAGTLNLKAILHAATQAGVKHFFVEQDQTPSDPIASLKVSASYLKGLSF
jgi:sugar phosphate isomerase/epimerase